MKNDNWIKIGIAAFLGQFLSKFIVWIFLLGMIPMLVIRELWETNSTDVGALFSDNPPYAEEAWEIYMSEVAHARSLGYTKENDYYLLNYYRAYPPKYDYKLRETVRNKLMQYRSTGTRY